MRKRNYRIDNRLIPEAVPVEWHVIDSPRLVAHPPKKKIMPNVKLFANLRKIAGTKELSVIGANTGAVVSELVKQYPQLAGHLLEDGHIRPHVIITINGHPTNDMDIALTEQDQIAIFPPIAGG